MQTFYVDPSQHILNFILKQINFYQYISLHVSLSQFNAGHRPSQDCPEHSCFPQSLSSLVRQSYISLDVCTFKSRNNKLLNKQPPPLQREFSRILSNKSNFNESTRTFKRRMPNKVTGGHF